MAAAENGNGAISSTLLNHGADPCISGSDLTALHFAGLNYHKSIFILLRDTGVWTIGKERSGMTMNMSLNFFFSWS